jgi:triosephosphate isomerase
VAGPTAAARAPFLVANWKMNLDRAAARDFCERLRGLDDELGREGSPVRLGVCPPFVYLAEVAAALAGTRIAVGGQTCRPEAQGAFTGEVSARMVKDVGASHVIVGHSERRRLFHETDSEVRARLDAALAAGLDLIFCLGETLDERNAGRTDEVVLRQLEAGVRGLPGETLSRRVTIAYEPVWAIGTGLTATPEQAQQVHALLRARLAQLAGGEAAARTTLQYGGSVKPENIADLFASPDVDGALVGGASLEFPLFAAIVRLAAPAAKAR